MSALTRTAALFGFGLLGVIVGSLPHPLDYIVMGCVMGLLLRVWHIAYVTRKRNEREQERAYIDHITNKHRVEARR